MTVYIDPPAVQGHGRWWSHLVSDTSYDELHALAATLGVPRRGFDRDHYDIPGELYAEALAAGAVPIASKELVARLAAAGLRRRKATALGRRRPGRPLTRPPRLRPGDTVAVVAPAGPAAPDRLAAGIDVLRRWQLEPKVMPHVAAPSSPAPYLAAADEQRAADLTDAWCDPEVRGVFCARGGYGVLRLLDLLDYDRMAEAGPRVLVGYSDITALHQVLAARLGLVTVHGPVLTGLGRGTADAAEHLRRLLTEPERALDLLTGLHAEVPGTAEGVVVGGNLALLAAGIGTRDVRAAADSIVLLEDVGEDGYRVDRLVTQLLRAGWFHGVRGVVVGELTDCPGALEALRERLVPLGVPMVSGAPVGHHAHNLAVPFGVPARLDADAGTLTLTRPALR